MELETILEQSDKLKQWYWDYGIHREGKYALRMGQWLDELHRLSSDARRIKNAENPRTCMALWGPSQTGKSTLLASYIDGPKEAGGEDSDPTGINSALTWSEESPARFVGDTRAADAVLNPFNNEADGSGCVTRFELKEEVKHEKYPVEVKFAERGQIMLALAVGWISQTDCKKTPAWRHDTLKEAYKDLEATGRGVSQESFELMVQVVDTLEILVRKYDLSRYLELREDWDEIRKQLLEEEKLISSRENIYKFASRVFWHGDEWSSISEAFYGLMEVLDDIEAKFGGNKVYASYRVAAILLNIQALVDLKDAENSANERLQKTKTLVENSKFKRTGEEIILCEDEGELLFPDKAYFGFFQGLVWELKVPLNRQKLIAIPDHEPALELLDNTDLLDFPGVAREDDGIGFSNEGLENDEKGECPVLTKVLKRGKTESIVVASSQEYNIDGFSLLVRMGQYPSKPDQLERGIEAWFESFDQGKFDETAKNSDLPINLVLTFSAWLMNQFRGENKGVGQIWSKMQNLRKLCDPEVVETFATNYAQFDPGHIRVGENLAGPEREAALKEVFETIVSDEDFKRQFEDHSASFVRITEPDGAKGYFLRRLAEQARGSRRGDLVRKKREKVEETFPAFLTRALPGEGDEAAQRVQDIDRVIASLEKTLATSGSPDPGMEIGGRIQNFVSVDHRALDHIPRQVRKRAKTNPIGPFLERQITNWKEDKGKLNGKSLVGLGDIDSDLAQKLLHYWGEAIDIKSLEDWFRTELGGVSREKDRREFRRFLAIKIGNLIFRGTSERPPYPSADEVSEKLVRLEGLDSGTEEGGYEESPFYQSIVGPFLKRLEDLKQSSSEERPPQPGDEELLQLFPRD